MEQPAWLEQGWREAGVRETPGPASNSRILQFAREIGHQSVSGDEVAWCAAFLGACLERSGIKSTRSLLARSYLDWGNSLEKARLGAVAVLSRGTDLGQGHVGFVVGATPGRIFLLGGNQGDAVSVEGFDRSRLLALRWPAAGEALPQSGAPSALFELALAHVLKMEGGFSDDPFDPGGPTNRGITLAVFASTRGIELTAANRASLIEGLKRLGSAQTRQIYATRYWDLSRAGLLPPDVAVMHFDAAVNHGVAAAVRMLQEAAGATVDGEIGPETLGRVRIMPGAELIARYADIRRARYRSLGHFWRFGRGWLRRVDQTLDAARRARSANISFAQPEAGDTSMPDASSTSGTGKWWGQSVTIWGALITAASTVLPVIGPLIGLDITSDLVHQIGDQVVAVVQAVGGLIGIAMTIYGRTRASQALERRQVTLHL